MSEKKHSRGPEYSGSKKERNLGFLMLKSVRCALKKSKQLESGRISKSNTHVISSMSVQVFKGFLVAPWSLVMPVGFFRVLHGVQYLWIPLDCGPMQVYRKPQPNMNLNLCILPVFCPFKVPVKILSSDQAIY